jgi:hypothetical protein
MHENRETSGTPRSRQDRDRSAKAQSHNADMHIPEESDCAVLPMNQPNKEEKFLAEVGEERAQAKENIVQSNTSPTQSGKRVYKGLIAVRRAAKERRPERFTALLHHASAGLLRDSFYALKGKKCSPCVRYVLLPMSPGRASENQLIAAIEEARRRASLGRGSNS